jgi:hypothetical protein
MAANPDKWVKEGIQSVWVAIYEAHNKNEVAILLNFTLLVGGAFAVWFWSQRSNPADKCAANGTVAGRNLNALSKRNKEFGENSYYYAHSKKYGDESTKWDGKPEPRLLRKEAPMKSPSKVAKSTLTGKPISKYAFADGTNKVKIYVDVPGLASLSSADSDASIANFEWTALSCTLQINGKVGTDVGLDLVLHLPLLFAPITAGKWQQKRAKEQIIVTLTKEEPGADWKKLTA